MSRSYVIKPKTTTSMSRKKSCPRGESCPYKAEYQHNAEYSHSSLSSNTQHQNKPSATLKSSKKICDLGRSCPYQEEFQHIQEYDHRPTGNDRHITASSNRSRGNTLGSNSNGSSSGPKRSIQSDLNDMRKKRCSALGVPEDASPRVDCDVCGLSITLSSWDTHARQHEAEFTGGVDSSSATSLKRMQDEEFEICQMQDIMRMSEQAELERQTKLMEQQQPPLSSSSSASKSQSSSSAHGPCSGTQSHSSRTSGNRLGSVAAPPPPNPTATRRGSAQVVNLMDEEEVTALCSRITHSHSSSSNTSSSNSSSSSVGGGSGSGSGKGGVTLKMGEGSNGGGGRGRGEVVVIDLESPDKPLTCTGD
jgi:hypothetical protein